MILTDGLTTRRSSLSHSRSCTSTSTRCNARIEITRAGTDERCVLVSKKELDALERAIEILSDTDDVRHVSQKLAHLAAIVTAGDYAQV